MSSWLPRKKKLCRPRLQNLKARTLQHHPRMLPKNLPGTFGKLYLSNGLLLHTNTTLVGHVITDVKILALTAVVSTSDGEQVWWWDSYPYLLMDCVTFDRPVEGCDPSRHYRGLSTTVTWAVLNELLYLNSDTACGYQCWHFVVYRSQAGG